MKPVAVECPRCRKMWNADPRLSYWQAPCDDPYMEQDRRWALEKGIPCKPCEVEIIQEARREHDRMNSGRHHDIMAIWNETGERHRKLQVWGYAPEECEAVEKLISECRRRLKPPFQSKIIQRRAVNERKARSRGRVWKMKLGGEVHEYLLPKGSDAPEMIRVGRKKVPVVRETQAPPIHIGPRQKRESEPIIRADISVRLVRLLRSRCSQNQAFDRAAELLIDAEMEAPGSHSQAAARVRQRVLRSKQRRQSKK